METAERNWKRWRKKNGKLRLTFTPESVPPASTVLLSPEQAREVGEGLARHARIGTFDIDPRLVAAGRMWIQVRCTRATVNSVAAEHRLSKQSVSRSVKRFRELCRYDTALASCLSYLIASVEARPTPTVALSS